MKTDMASTLTNALSGLQVGISNAAAAAGEVQRLTTGSQEVQDAVQPLLKLQDSKNEVAVASKVVQTDKDTLGSLIDVKV